MPESATQGFASHRRYVPLFHFVTSFLLVVNLGWAFVRIYHSRGGGRFDKVDGGVQLVLAVALVLLCWFVRSFPVAVQDRLIRLEMRLRLAEVLPGELRGRIPELSTGQLIALRFASDGELPELTRKVLDERIAGRDAIKQLIRSWQADDARV